MLELEGTLPKYLEFKVFELFRDRFINIISPYAKAGSKVDVYKQLFLCPSNLSKKQSFKLHGVLSPYVCLWRDSAVSWNTDDKFYGRSVLPRQLQYQGVDGETKTVNGYLYDLKTTFELYSSSYYRDFRDRVNQDLIDLDRQRYFIFSLKEMFPDAAQIQSTAELKLEGLTSKDDVENDQSNRAFNLAAKYSLKITVPYTREAMTFKKIEIYLQENKIYEKEIIDEKNGLPTGK